VLAELAKLAFANFADCLSVDDDGAVDFDLAKLDRDQVAAIREISVEYADTPDGAPRKIKRLQVRMFDKRQALADLARHLGLVAGQPAKSGAKQAVAEVPVEDVPIVPMNNVEYEKALVDVFATFANANVDLPDLLQKAVAESKVRISPHATPLSQQETITSAMARLKKLMKAPLEP
jgi:hypothetical protein